MLTLRLGNLYSILQEIIADPSHAQHFDECTPCSMLRSGFESVMTDFDRTTLHSLLIDKFTKTRKSTLSKLSFTGSLTTLEQDSETLILSAREKGPTGKTARVLIQIKKEDLANMLLGQQEINCTVASEVLTKG
jgi:hypothetical protein